MKRIAWLLLAVFCAALAQAPRVDALVAAKVKTCDCCKIPRNCGVPECFACAAPLLPAFSPPPQSLRLVRSPAGLGGRQLRPAASTLALVLVQRATARGPVVAAAAAAPPVGVPLFKAHRSFLL